MLDEKSIFKSLHCNLKSKEQSPTEVAVQCIEGAMREWWFYGEEVFNNRHEQMKEVVKRLGWENFMSPGFDDTYHQRRERWFEENEVFYADDEIVEVQESE
jgi:dissimilatory sulfite reductase (desulfoviridin) alpha/beta subunit